MANIELGQEIYGIVTFSNDDINKYDTMNIKWIYGTVVFKKLCEDGRTYMITISSKDKKIETVHERLCFISKEEMIKYLFESEKILINKLKLKLDYYENLFKTNKDEFVKTWFAS